MVGPKDATKKAIPRAVDLTDETHCETYRPQPQNLKRR
jgi:hypothetical protein